MVHILNSMITNNNGLFPNSYHDFNIHSLIAKSDQGYDDYYEDENPPFDYEDEYAPNNTKRFVPTPLANLIETFRNHKQLGASLVGLGLIMTFVGLMLFFNGLLLRVGNICIILGVPLLVGPDSVKQFFLQKSRTQASIITALGIFLVMWGRPRLGILFEIFGLLSSMG